MTRWDNKPSLAEMKKDFMSHLTEEGQAYFNEVIDKDGTTRIDDLTEFGIQALSQVGRER